MTRLAAALAVATALGCGAAKDAARDPGDEPAAPPKRTKAETKGATKKAGDPLFPARERGWKAAAGEQRAAIAAYADDYAAFLARAKTPRRAIDELVAVYAGAGATELAPGEAAEHAPGAKLYVRGGPASAAFVHVGRRPLEDGLRVVVAAVDAPRIDLKQTPLYRDEDADLAMFDTFLYGDLELATWLARPMALYLHATTARGAVSAVVGEDPDDPVLAIPDLLPHLSGHVQRKEVVDDAERMDAIAARALPAVRAFLDAHGLDEDDLAAAEVSIVPAGPPAFVGVDRALLAGYGHSHRALAYAATRALAETADTEHTAIVVAISKDQVGGTGSAGLGFARAAVTRIVSALAGGEVDLLVTRRVFARSAALLADRLDGEHNAGLVLSPRADDALPEATRRALDAFDAAAVQYQISGERGWSGAARRLGALDMDVVAVAVPATGHGTPLELASTLDLYHAFAACRAWLVSP